MMQIEHWILMSSKRVFVNMAFILNQRYLCNLTYFFAGAGLQNKVFFFCNDLEYLHSTLLSAGWGHVVNLQK